MSRFALVFAVGLLFATAVPATGGAAPAADVKCDFDGDGRGEWVWGDPYAGVPYRSGEVYVMYGKNGGLSQQADETWTQDSPGVKDSADQNDFFGWAHACGDFNGDGYDDLAVGAMAEQVGGILYAGAVNVIYGSPTGLDAGPDQFIHRNTKGISGGPKQDAQFGRGLAAGDFDGDGHDDLAVGSPFETIDGVKYAGAVNVIYGSEDGLTGKGDQRFSQNSAGIKGKASYDDEFGMTMNTGDFDGNGRDDLVIGGGRETVSGQPLAGAINVIYGAKQGLDQGKQDEYWHQDKKGMSEKADASDWFGNRTAVGDFNGDGRDDLAIGIQYEDGHGKVQVMYGVKGGLSAGHEELWDQDTSGVLNAAQDGDLFGEWVAASDFDGNGKDDLAISVTGEDLKGKTNAGAVAVLYGKKSGLSAGGNQLWHRGKKGIAGALTANAGWGRFLATNDFNGDGFGDFIVLGYNFNAAAMYYSVLDGSSSGVKKASDQYFPRP